MKKLVPLLAGCALAFTFTLSHAADEAKAPTAQQNKMTQCNKDAGDKKGDDRKAFMKSCLSSKPAPVTQQDKMKICNQQAEGKKGDERKAFMSTCLKKAA